MFVFSSGRGEDGLGREYVIELILLSIFDTFDVGVVGILLILLISFTVV